MSLVETTGQTAAAQKQPTFAQELGGKITQFSAALPKHIPQERFARVVMTAVQRNPDLLRADRQSLWNSSMQAAADGLLPDGREGALVIYNTKEKIDGRDVWIQKVQWMPMIAGIRKKVRNSKELSDWSAHVVHAKDEFEFELGDDPFIKHKPFMGGDRGPVIAAYSVATFREGGDKSREVMMRSDIEKVRQRSKQKDKDGNPTGPWKTDYEEMCRKTVARRHSKVLPVSTDLDDLIRRDDALYDLQGASDKVSGNARLSLGNKLDALANMADPEQDAPMLSKPGAAPAAEQMSDQSQGHTTTEEAPDTKPADEQPPTAAADTLADSEGTPRDLLILDLRDAIDSGARVSKLLNDLAPEKRDLLTDEDVKALHARAKKVQG